MKAIHFLGNKKAVVAEIPMPELTEGRLLVKILASAVCGSERPSWLQPHENDEPTLSGHEAVGEIEDPNGSTRFKKGDRVCIQIMNGCGECYYCKKGFPTFCPDLQFENGCHAQYIALPESCLVPIDRDIPPETAVLLGGDLLGVAHRAARQLPIKKGEYVFISGGGPIGQGMTFMMKALGAKVILSDPHEFHRNLAKEHAGADITLAARQQDVRAALMDLTDGIGPEITIECSGNPQAQIEALEWTRCQGHVMFCGENYKGLNIIPSDHIIHKELTVHGAFYFAPGDVPGLVELYRNGMNPAPLVSHKVSIDDAPAAMEQFFTGNAGKVIIFPNQD